MTDADVSLVIPGRNCASTIRACLEAVVPRIEDGGVREIIFVDDGSTDATVKIVSTFPVTLAAGSGKGPGAARNVGWRRACGSYVWFIDADCVAERDALPLLLAEMGDGGVAGVSGSYGIMNAESLLARLIHEEIVERHRLMPRRVNFAATFNVLYRRSVLESLGGFDERYLKAQDAEFSYRVIEAGHELHFVFASKVRHFHPTRWMSYLRTQRKQGFWRAWLHLSHPGRTMGDSYSGSIDHLQPPLAVAVLSSIPLLLFPSPWVWVTAALTATLLAAQLPMTLRLLRRLRAPSYAAFALMSFVRAFWRGVGLVQGCAAYALSGKTKD